MSCVVAPPPSPHGRTWYKLPPLYFWGQGPLPPAPSALVPPDPDPDPPSMLAGVGSGQLGAQVPLHRTWVRAGWCLRVCSEYGRTEVGQA